MKKIPLIILTGPTAVGKTDLSIKLSKSLNAEIISADSMQIYKYMDIGSAKVTKEEMDGVVHYMIDEVTPDVPFSVSEFQMRSEKYIQEINKRVDIMLENGLLDEVKELLKMGYTKDMISMQGIGYKEMIKYLDGEYTYDEAIEIIKRDSRRYAKRQLTWFKRYQDAKWFDLDKYQDIEILKEDIINHIEKLLEIV